MKLLVDVAKLEADGTITPQQGVEIRRAAAADTGTLAINVMATIGAFAVVAGLLAMRPTSVQVAVIGLGLTLSGALIRKLRPTQVGFLGSSLIVIGAVLLAAGLILKCSGVAPRASSFLFACPATPKWYGHMVLFLIAAAWLLAVGALAQNGLLVVLSAFALAGALGSSTGYWHASYGLLVRESTVTIAVFGLLGALASYLSMQVLQEPYARLARLFALMALLWVNFGFWVGSLWGDHPLEAWMAPDVMSPPYSKEAWDALQAWKAKAFFISRDVYAAAWALALAGVGAWGAMHSRRGAVNMAATFGGIHFYTQWFERLRATPEMVIAAGIIAVAMAFVLWRYNQRPGAATAA
jgi:iron complex transport system permease protein